MNETGYPLLWLDFETSGLDVDLDHVLEFACVLTEPFPGCERLWAHHAVLPLTPKAEARLTATPEAMAMHVRTGLLDESRFAGPVTLDDIETAVIGALDNLGYPLLQLVGTGVSHFDIHLIRRLMPRLYSRLYYGPLDVGQLRRWFRVAGLSLPPETDNLAHRAMPDVERSMFEAGWFLGQLSHLREPARQ